MEAKYWLSKAKVFLGGWLIRPSIGRLIQSRCHGLIPCGRHVFNIGMSSHVSYQEVARLFFGYYEKSERKLIRRNLSRRRNVIELGSGIGVVSCCILEALDAARSLLCVEGNPQTIETLRANIARNFCGRDVGIINAAIDYSGRTKVGYKIDVNIIGSSVGPGADAELVPTATFGDIYRDSGFGEYSLVCDIEGAEAAIFTRDRAALRLCGQIIAELHETKFDQRNYSVDDLRSAIEDIGFHCSARRHNVFVFDRINVYPVASRSSNG